MLTIGVFLLCVAALGFVGLAAKYILGEAPLDYHANILAHDGVTVTSGHARVFRAIYAVMGSFALALAVALAALALYPISEGALWARVTVLVVSVIAGWGGCAVPFFVERATGVRTPWRPAAALLSVVAIGLVFTSI